MKSHSFCHAQGCNIQYCAQKDASPQQPLEGVKKRSDEHSERVAVGKRFIETGNPEDAENPDDTIMSRPCFETVDKHTRKVDVLRKDTCNVENVPLPVNHKEISALCHNAKTQLQCTYDAHYRIQKD